MDQNNQPPVAGAVAIRPPTFSPNKVNAYFKILEAQLQIANVTTPATKFRHLLSNLPIEVIDKLSDEQTTCEDYDELKQAVIAMYSKPNNQIFNELLAVPTNLATKPTIFLQQLKTNAAQLNLSDDFLKIYFIQSMPNHMRSTLVTHNGTLEDIAKLADTLVDYNVTPYNYGTSSNMSFMNPISQVNARPQYSPRPQYHDNRYSSPSSNHHTYTAPSIPPSIRAFHDKQKPRVCRSHLWFGHQARSCKQWCILNNNSLPLAPNSRPSSPHHNQSGNA